MRFDFVYLLPLPNYKADLPLTFGIGNLTKTV